VHKTKKRVLMAMSGGIDSSVAAILLHKQGYEVIGVTMKTWDYSTTSCAQKETGCCNLDTINDARSIAVNFGFPHYIIDLKELFNNTIVENFIQEYLAGRTPNPCVLCNALIKWDALLKKADVLGCDFIATGHYAQIKNEAGRFVLSAGVDTTKDQSYVLWQLTQENLKRTLFPLGNLTKNEVRKIAIDLGLDTLAVKKESYEICFIPDDDYRKFLRERIPELDTKIGEGNFVDENGKILGIHKGFPYYTIGQRKGLNIAAAFPLYVKKINAQTNTIILTHKDGLSSTDMLVGNINLIKFESIPTAGLKAVIKIRYKDKGTYGTIYPTTDKLVKVKFEQSVSAVTPGQSAVFLDGTDVIGGGIILE